MIYSLCACLLPAPWLDHCCSASSCYEALWRVPDSSTLSSPRGAPVYLDLTLLPRWGSDMDSPRNTKWDQHLYWKETEITVAGIKVKMEEDPSDNFYHLSLTALISDLLGLFRKKYHLYLCSYCVATGEPRRPSDLPVSNSTKVRRTRAVCQVWWLILCVKLAGPWCLDIWSNIILRVFFGWDYHWNQQNAWEMVLPNGNDPHASSWGPE